MVFDDFLGAKECEDLMSVAAADLRRSRVTDGKLSDGRTSSSTFLTGAKRDVAVVRAVERRVLSAARLAGLVAEERAGAEGHERARLAGAEPMQVVRYDRGQMYTAHYDNKQGCVRRAATFMMYLTDVDAGGATHFPKAVPRGEERRRPQKSPASASVEDPDATTLESPGRGGVRVWPKRGRALVFWSVRGGAEDAWSLHEAEPVVEGEKWIATKWLQVEDAARPGAASDARGARAVFG
jgi:prolyl 4-hydroxylase